MMEDKRTGTILIVDDQKSWRKLLVTVLEADGHKTETASNFEEANQLLQTENFDLAILDIRLIDASVYNIDGLRLLKEAKKHQPSIKSIILTDYPDQEQEKKAYEYGADDYCRKVPDGKPLDLEKFSQLISDLLLKS